MSELSDFDLQSYMQKLKQDLTAFPEGMNSLESELESSAKHIPAYLKIVKGHIDQLAKVLELENHNHRTLETASLAEPVQQLIRLFRELHDEDLQILEELAVAARNWQPEYQQSEPDDTSLEEATTASEV
jgi:hypothetical protein